MTFKTLYQTPQGRNKDSAGANGEGVSRQSFRDIADTIENGHSSTKRNVPRAK